VFARVNVSLNKIRAIAMTLHALAKHVIALYEDRTVIDAVCGQYRNSKSASVIHICRKGSRCQRVRFESKALRIECGI